MSDNKKTGTPKHRSPQDDIPYEYRMKYIIEGYRSNLERLDALEKYARKLERILEQEKSKRREMGETNKKLAELSTKRGRKSKALLARCIWLQDRIREIKLYFDNNEPVPDELWQLKDIVKEIESMY